MFLSVYCHFCFLVLYFLHLLNIHFQFSIAHSIVRLEIIILEHITF